MCDPGGRVVIRGERVVLRPFHEKEFDVWYGARIASAGDATVNPVGAPEPERLRARVERSGIMHEGWLDLAIDRWRTLTEGEGRPASWPHESNRRE